MISDIHHASFTVSDMKRSVAFYRDILGMEVVRDTAQAGVEFKGPLVDNLTNCPGSELRIVFLRIKERLLELVNTNRRANRW